MSAARPGPRTRAIRVVRGIVRLGRFLLLNSALMGKVKYLRRVTEVPGRVSIITATYDRPGRLAEAIDSVRSQTYSHWEQIVVSDGRDDRVPALVARYGDSRITAYHTRRVQVWGNYQRNFALQYATGEFVLYLDDDNILYPDALAAMVSGFTSADIGYVVCPIRYGDSVLRPPRDFVSSQIDLLNYMVRRRLVIEAGGQNMLYSADYYLIDKIRRISRGEFRDTLIGHHR